MASYSDVNRVLKQHAPVVERCLSSLGRQAVFPEGVPFQSAQAKQTELNATIGQVTDGHGNPIPLPALRDAASELDERMAFLYSPQAGQNAVRQRWQQFQLQRSGSVKAERISLPLVTHGAGHASPEQR